MRYNRNGKGHMSITKKEKNKMPRRDGTGPINQGENNLNARGQGLQWGNGSRNRQMENHGRRGFGRGLCRNINSFSNDKRMLVKQQEFLQKELEIIRKQLENL